ESPRSPAVSTDAESFGGGGHHDLGARGVREHLVDVALDVDRRRPGPPAVARAYDAADVHVAVDRAVPRDRDRPDVCGIAPRGVPGGAPVGRLERLDRRHAISGEPKQMRLLGADQKSLARRGQTRRLVAFDRRALRPARVGALPERPAVGDGPLAGAVGRERGQGFPSECFYSEHPVAVVLPEAVARADPDPRDHAQIILARARRCEVRRAGLDSKVAARVVSRRVTNIPNTTPDHPRRSWNDFSEAGFERGGPLPLEPRGRR